MASVSIKKLLGKDGSLAVSNLLTQIEEPIEILDAEGNLLFGGTRTSAEGSGDRIPLMSDGMLVGWVVGEKDSAGRTNVAELLAFLLKNEAEKKSLAAEVLDRYRELHLLYRLSEKLSSSLQPEVIASMALGDVCQMIQVVGGMIILDRTRGKERKLIAACGNPFTLKMDLPLAENILKRVTKTGIAEIANDVNGSDYFEGTGSQEVSLLCAPLKTEKRVSGVIILVNDPSKPFTAGELKLVSAIAMQTAPAIEIAYLHQLELEKERMDMDLKMAHQVQSGLLPRNMPVMEGWKVAAHWQPAREVSGDFYEFIEFPHGKYGFAIADVTDKGMPAALVMANTRSVLRAVAAVAGRSKNLSPGRLLSRANNVLCQDMPMNMFTTCFLVVLEPASGRIVYANAGQNLPYLRTEQGTQELNARGMPLGLFRDIVYEEKEAVIGRGDSLLMYSDGLVEAHNPHGEMYGNPRLEQVLSIHTRAHPLDGQALIQYLLDDLRSFTGPDWEQEDDVTFLTLERCR
ncbi:MAG TPA: GAF domain-containing SpoIIE family protein phosphatase [Anaerolineales bacterium]|nr:GAF domain-containing SpoIIE family protein phosphatase [Anaerolineales bacterium]